MAHWMGKTWRVTVGLVLLLGLVGCGANGGRRTVVPPPTWLPPSLVYTVKPPLPAATTTAATTTVATRPAPLLSGNASAVDRLAIRGRVILDPGHGGKDSGAEAGDIVEKWLVLEVATAAADELRRRGVTVLMTRRNDTFVELEDRANAANNFRADLFVAIHADSNPSPLKLGHSILLPQSGNSRAGAAAQWLDRGLTAAGSPSYTIRQDNRGLYVLRHITCPAILLEMGFLSNPVEAGLLRNPAYRHLLSQAIAKGVIDYLQHK